jgi:hypothetical protein
MTLYIKAVGRLQPIRSQIGDQDFVLDLLFFGRLLADAGGTLWISGIRVCPSWRLLWCQR